MASLPDAKGAQPIREFTLRAILLGGAITLVFTAANVYLGLRVGLTFATSIPAAVISMAVLRMFAHGTILENNIVQTVASAAGTLAAIIFVLPGLVIIGWWNGFPYWITTGVTAVGGILGVMFSVPLRRALVVDSPLPYPEGVAAAEVLKCGSGEASEENDKGLRLIVTGSLAAAAFTIVAKTRLFAEEAATYFNVGASSTGIAGGLSFALIGAGHLVGISVGMALLTGLVIGWWIVLPIMTAGVPGAAEEVAGAVFRSEVRFFGAGVIGVAAIWALLRIIGPILKGIKGSLAASKLRGGGAEALPLVERDMPIGVVGTVILLSLAPIALLLWLFIAGGPLAPYAVPLIIGSLLFVLIAGVVIASVCGYMAGLIGASNSPISGIGILAILAASLLLALWFGGAGSEAEIGAMTAYALFTTAIVFGIATISNDNLQDLKTGQLVGATPWRQQLALVYGVIFGAIVIPPVLDMLNTAYGFAGAPGAGPDALAAPQAGLISALATGVLGGDLNWRMIFIGAGVGVAAILLDEVLGRAKLLRVPPLAVGIGIYLPMAVTLPVVIGAVLGKLYDKRAEKMRDPAFAKRMGVLLATGLIVGDSLLNVAFAGLVAATGDPGAIALAGPDFGTIALIAGTLGFIALLGWLYRYTRRAAA
ncbi:MAG: OPT family oligopeptide transporter [Sphingosinicella sp.]|uniref:OPT family oligopeptide transporter n=1 Tax=Sphingosinicella sp. TaxID=1917971 RepID=UPI004037E5EB